MYLTKWLLNTKDQIKLTKKQSKHKLRRSQENKNFRYKLVKRLSIEKYSEYNLKKASGDAEEDQDLEMPQIRSRRREFLVFTETKIVKWQGKFFQKPKTEVKSVFHPLHCFFKTKNSSEVTQDGTNVKLLNSIEGRKCKKRENTGRSD